jgi:hypothetical protein
MNFFTKNKFVFWLLIFLVVVNLSALATFLVLFSRNSSATPGENKENACNVFRKELGLSPAQTEKVDLILSGYRKSTEPVAESLREYRVLILEELAKTDSDTTLLKKYSDGISLLQSHLQTASVGQYLSLKEICTPEQCQRLSALYFELYGCQGKCKQPGKGMMHRHRNSQAPKDCGKM